LVEAVETGAVAGDLVGDTVIHEVVKYVDDSRFYRDDFRDYLS
jgi:hypothetical protein